VSDDSVRRIPLALGLRPARMRRPASTTGTGSVGTPKGRVVLIGPIDFPYFDSCPRGRSGRADCTRPRKRGLAPRQTNRRMPP
jgi:hypothetical protein